MSVQYALLKAAMRVIHAQKLMARPYDDLMRLFRTAEAVPEIPKLIDPRFTFETRTAKGSPVLTINHVRPTRDVCIYVVGGGMLKYPKPSQARGLISLANETRRDFVLPYFPLRPRHDLFDALDMLLATYRKVLRSYEPERVAFLGGSSGAYMTLCLLTLINEREEGLPLPGKVYLSSPGSALLPEERKAAEQLNRTDLIMSTTALDNIFAGMAGGKELPDYLYHMQRGNYAGVRDVHLTYGGDEVFSAAASSTANRLRSFGANVQLEVGEGMYHAYAAMPLVPEARPAYDRMLDYLRV